MERNVHDKGAVFDTTAINTGIHNGAVAFLERLLKRTLLHLACRHHVAEIELKTVFEHCLSAEKSLEVSIFNLFFKKWTSLDHLDFDIGISGP